MALILALDPGDTHTGAVVLDSDNDPPAVLHSGVHANERIVNALRGRMARVYASVVIEMIASYGKPVGRSTFETVLWIGRYVESVQCCHLEEPVTLITRREVKYSLCGNAHKVTDAVVRQRLIDLYGGSRAKAIGTKKEPGPLYGVKSHCWAALAVGWASLNRDLIPRMDYGPVAPLPLDGNLEEFWTYS